MELGGNAPCIIFDDADIDVAVKGSVSNIIMTFLFKPCTDFLNLKVVLYNHPWAKLWLTEFSAMVKTVNLIKLKMDF